MNIKHRVEIYQKYPININVIFSSFWIILIKTQFTDEAYNKNKTDSKRNYID